MQIFSIIFYYILFQMINLLKSFNLTQQYKLSSLQNFLHQSKISKKHINDSQANLPYNNRSLQIKKLFMHKEHQQEKNSICQCQYHRRVKEKIQSKNSLKQKVKDNEVKQYKCKIANVVKYENKILKANIEARKKDEITLMKQKIKKNNQKHREKINNIKYLSKNRRNFDNKENCFGKNNFRKLNIDNHNYQYQHSISRRNNTKPPPLSSSRSSHHKQSKINQYLKVCNSRYQPLIKYLIKLGYEGQNFDNLNSILQFFEQSYKKYDKKQNKFKFYNNLKNQCFLNFKMKEIQISKLILAWNKFLNLDQPKKKIHEGSHNVNQQNYLLRSNLSSIQNKKFEASHSILSSISRRSSKLFQLYSLKDFVEFQQNKIDEFAHAQKQDILFGLEHIQNQLKQQYQKSKNSKIVPQYIIELKTSSFVERVLKKIQSSQILSQLEIHQRSEILQDGLKVIHHYEEQMINLDHSMYEEQQSYISKNKKKLNKKSVMKFEQNYDNNNNYIQDFSSKQSKKVKNSTEEKDPYYQPKRISNIIFKKQKKKLKDQQIYRPKIKEMIPEEQIQQDQEKQKQLQQKMFKNRIRKRRQARIQDAATLSQSEIIQQKQAKQKKYSPRQTINCKINEINEKYKSPLVKIYHLKLNLILEQINEKLISKNLIQFKINEQDNNFVRRRKIKRLKKFLEQNQEFSDAQITRNINLYQQHDMMTKTAKYDYLDQLSNISSNTDDKMLLYHIINAVQANQNNAIKLGPELKELEYISSSQNLSEQGEYYQQTNNKQELKLKNQKTQCSQKQIKQNEYNVQNEDRFHKYHTVYHTIEKDDDLIQKNLDSKNKIQELFLPSFTKITKKQKKNVEIKNNKKSKIKQILKKEKQKRPEVFQTLLNFNFKI